MKALLAVPLVLLAGCASLSSDGGFSSVEQSVESRTGAQAKWVRSEDEANSVRTRVKELLAKPLSAEDAVQIALLNNAGLQAQYAEVGIAEADLVQASRWRGPTFSFARLRRGDEIEYEDAGIDAAVVWIREDSQGRELWRGIHEGEIPEVGAELGRSGVDGRPWVVRRIEKANGRVAIHVSKEGPTGDPHRVGHHMTVPPRVP